MDARHQFKGQLSPERRKGLALSSQQFECAKLAARGLSNKEIARQTGKGEGTVKVHLALAMAKLDVPNRSALAALFGPQEPVAVPVATIDPEKLHQIARACRMLLERIAEATKD